MLTRISCEMTFGPAYHESESTTMPVDDYLKVRMERYERAIMASFSGLQPDGNSLS